jgi:hypothetical protein
MLNRRDEMFKQGPFVQVPAKVRELFVVVVTEREYDQLKSLALSICSVEGTKFSNRDILYKFPRSKGIVCCSGDGTGM